MATFLRHRTLPGCVAAREAYALWDAMPEKIQRAALFDVAWAQRRKVFAKILAFAAHVCIMELDPGHAVGWTIPTGFGALTAACHFVMPDCDDDRRNEAARCMARQAARYYRNLFCLVPCCYAGVRKMLAAGGFNEVARLAGACFIALHDRCVDGVLYVWRAR